MAPPKGYKHSDKARKRISESHKGKTSNWKGKHHSEETKKRLSEAATGFRHSQETKEKIGDIHRGKVISEKHRRQISNALKGRKRKPFKEETKRKMSKFQKDLWNKNKTSISTKRKQLRVNGKLKMVSHIIWEKNYGKIPMGYIIHHKDLNPENNDINNLLMLTRSKHTKLHRGLKK